MDIEKNPSGWLVNIKNEDWEIKVDIRPEKDVSFIYFWKKKKIIKGIRISEPYKKEIKYNLLAISCGFELFKMSISLAKFSLLNNWSCPKKVASVLLKNR